MRNFILTFLCLFLFNCTSKVKEGANLSIYNYTSNDLFMVDKYYLDNINDNEKIQIFIKSIDINTKENRLYMKEGLITMYTNKTIFFPLINYNQNRKYQYLIFYFIKRNNLDKTKKEILTEKLYDSIKINLDKFHQKGNDNHIYIEKNMLTFKNF